MLPKNFGEQNNICPVVGRVYANNRNLLCTLIVIYYSTPLYEAELLQYQSIKCTQLQVLFIQVI